MERDAYTTPMIGNYGASRQSGFGRMRFRKLRIAWSVVCGQMAVLLIMLWVRSYWVIEGVEHCGRTSSDATGVSICSNHGTLVFTKLTVLNNSIDSIDFTGWLYETARPEFTTKRQFDWEFSGNGFSLQFPTWLLAILIAAGSWIPWLEPKWKFSLRTLLIATTLIAVVLGLIVYAARN
jgi:hypothetical protein